MTSDYARIESAIGYLHQHAGRQPTLAEAARSVHLSEFHFQRLFRRWAGVSPKRFLQFLTLERAKTLLAQDRGVLDAAYQAGLSGPGRLHDLFVTLEGLSPGEWKSAGAGLVVTHAKAETPFGPAWVAATARGICAVRFLGEGASADDELAAMRDEWPAAEFRESRDDGLARRVAAAFQGEPGEALALQVRGTNFQLQVWKALLSVPEGSVLSYEALAERIGRPRAVRAVASAVAANPVAYLIPCHRVIRKVGGIGEYRWGAARKRAMIGWEAARREGAGAG